MDVAQPPASKRMWGAYVAVVAAIAIVFVITQATGGDSTAQATAEATAAAHADFHAPVLELDDLVVGLADGGYLKLGLALQLSAPDEEAEQADEYLSVLARDVALETVGAYSRADLLRPEGRDKAKTDLIRGLQGVHDGEITSVYITGFAVQ